MRVKKRHRIRRKEIDTVTRKIEKSLGCRVFSEDEMVDRASAPNFDILLVGGKALGLIVDGEPFLTVRGLLHYRPTKRYVTVDMGAVPFVCNGADIMSPGVVDADPSIEPGDLVWIRDERNLQPLAVARALIRGPEMVERSSGKAAESIHYVGDRLWKLDEE